MAEPTATCVGDAYIKHDDDALDVVRNGARESYHYVPGAWTDVEGDQKSWKKGFFRR